jgi:signal transduction histidine kinase
MNVPNSSAPAELERLQALVHAQARLVQAVQELSLVRTLPAIQEIVRRAARDIAGSDGATFILREGDMCHYADEDAISPLWKGQRFPMAACVSGWAMLNARSVVIPDIYADSRVPADAYRPTFVKSLVMVPIRLDSPIGAIGVYWAKHRTATEAEVTLLQALANTTSVAMENMKVYTELEQRVASRTRQLELLNRELESFSYSVSHDLRAPLRAINGFSGLLVRELDSNPAEKVQRYVNVIADSAIKMTALIEDLLKLSRVARERLRRIDVDLAAIARTIAQRLRTEDPRREAELVIPEQLVVRGDAGLMAVVMENLLSNAWKYTSKTGRARIVLGTRAEADGSTAVYVEDNGAGFDSSRAENLFSPFQRMHTAEEFPGTGVGLATVQRIIHRHGGRIWADAKPGQGARFSFTIADKDS